MYRSPGTKKKARYSTVPGTTTYYLMILKSNLASPILVSPSIFIPLLVLDTKQHSICLAHNVVRRLVCLFTLLYSTVRNITERNKQARKKERGRKKERKEGRQRRKKEGKKERKEGKERKGKIITI